MLNEALLFLLNTLLQPFAAVLLLRFHLQWLHAPMRNPLGEFIMAISNFAVLRARRFIPAARGLDIASLILAFGVEAMYLSTTYWIVGLPIAEFSLLGLMAWTAVKLLKLSIYLLVIALLVQVILSWVNPSSPVAGMLNVMTRPFLMPLRRYIPPLGNVDLTTLVLLIVCQLILIIPVSWLENMTRLF